MSAIWSLTGGKRTSRRQPNSVAIDPFRKFALAREQPAMLLFGGQFTDRLGAFPWPPKRRLAAVLAADIAGYSRLMGNDEEGTLARLKAVRKALVDPCVSRKPYPDF